MKTSELCGFVLLVCCCVFTVVLVKTETASMLEEQQKATERIRIENVRLASRQLETERYMHSIGCITLDCAISKAMKH